MPAPCCCCSFCVAAACLPSTQPRCPCFAAPALLPQVYLAKWNQTTVAVKVLLSTALDAYREEALQQALTLSSPVLANLQKEAGLMASLRHPNVVVRRRGALLQRPCRSLHSTLPAS